jgi:putative RecB family exonuclease
VRQVENNELKPPPHLSPSSLSTFEQCPLKFKYNKIDLIPDKPGKEAMLGNFVHDVLEALYKLPSNERTVQSARVLAGEIWASTWAEMVTPLIRSSQEIKNFRWQAWFCIENLWLVEDPQAISPIGLESELNHSLGGVKVKGFIDRYTKSLSDGIVISDYKTGKTPRKEWVSDKFEQLRIYAAIMQETQMFPVTDLELIYLKDGVKFNEVITEDSMSATIQRIQRIKESIDKRCSDGYFEPVKSRLCDWCSYKNICPAWSRKK